MQKRSLGRGLSDLLSGVGAVSTRGVIEVELDRIQPNPYQPRRVFTEEDLSELASSIRQQGVLQPLLVREAEEGYQLIAGERRWRAAAMAGLATVPCLVNNLDDTGLLMLALIENLQREDLDVIEQARAYRQLIEQFGLTQEEVADRIGKSRPAVANCLRLLALPAEVQEAVSSGALSEGHARALLAVREDPARLYEICQEVAKKGLSVRETEELARKSSPVASGRPRRRHAPEYESDPLLQTATERIQESLATKVVVTRRSSGGGTIAIHYHDDEELSRLMEAIAPEEWL
jgi:ParB family chromosome partitioning protein